MRKYLVILMMAFPLVAFSQAVRKDTIIEKKDTLKVGKDSLTIRKDSLVAKKDSSAMKKDSLAMRKDSLGMKKDSLSVKTDSLIIKKDALTIRKEYLSERKEALVIKESRFNISGGMGLNVILTKDVINYLNYYIPEGYDKFRTIGTAPDFYFNCEYRFWEDYGLKLEYGDRFKTFNMESTNEVNGLEVAYFIHSPSLLINYIVRAPGYLLKFGAGLCFNIADFTRQVSSVKDEEHYSANGMGIKLDAFGHTQFGSNFYMVFGLYLRTGFLGDLKNRDGEYLLPKQKVNMSFVYIGLSFGLAYYF